MTTASAYLTIDEIIEANRRAGGLWFSDDAMRFFGTRIPGVGPGEMRAADALVYGGGWFVYSNAFTTSDGVTTIYWKVAHALPDGEVCGDGLPWGTGDKYEANGSVGTELDARRYALTLENGTADCQCVRCDAERRRG